MLHLGEMDPITQSCFVMEIQGSGKHTLGNKDESHGIKEKDEY